jgi:ATP-dependent helicase/nuclease subunit A
MTAYERASQNQAIAADPSRSVFVTANAGSGKTKVLVDRIARLLLAGAPPSSFLCITYTKAAAAEMQRRLFERLGAWCVADDDVLAKDLKRLVGAALSSETMTKARALFAHALEQPGGLKIQTIHAFCERLLGRFPLEAGVAPGFEVAEDSRAADALGEAWSAILAEPDIDVSAALARMAMRLSDERFQELMREVIDKRVEIGAYVRRYDSAEAIREAVRRRHAVQAEPCEIVRNCLARVDWSTLRRAAEVLALGAASDQRIAERICAALSSRDETKFERLCEVFIRNNGEQRKIAPTKRARSSEPWLDRLFSDDGEQGRVVRALSALNAAERARDCIAALAIASTLDRAYEQAKARRGVLDFIDLVERAHRLLTRADCAPWVLFKLDGGLDHILIDEGQDTSPAQWALLRPLQEEFFAGAGRRDRQRTMFAVGDPKQSIYSFQGADPTKFGEERLTLESRAKGAGKAFVAPSLEMSFRSAPEVLAAVDATFRTQWVGGDLPSVFEALHHDARREGERGRVEWWPLALRPDRPEARPWDAPLDIEPADSAPVRLSNEIVARASSWIENREGVWDAGALRPMRAGDILVLVRQRGALFRQLLKAFKRAGFPVAGADRMVLKDELAVEDCLTLLRVAVDPADDLSLACLLKSPWIGLTDDDRDLFPLAHAREQGETLWRRLERAPDLFYGSAREFVRQLGERAGSDAYSLLSWALEGFDQQGRSGWERLFSRLGAEARDPIEELLNRALAAHRRGPACLHSFLAEIERDDAEVKRELEAAGESIRVMTVHGAKGLEAPVVILPDTTAAPNNRGDPDLFITENGPVFSASAREDDEVCTQARAEAGAREKGEHLRLLYVAMTRARDRLVICGAARGQGAGSAHAESWHTLVGAAMGAVGVPIETPFGPGHALGETLIAPYAEQKLLAQAPPPAWTRLPVAARRTEVAAVPSKFRKEPPAISPRGDGQGRFRRGQLIHGLLQRLPDAQADAREALARTWLSRRGVGAEEAEALIAETLSVLNDPRFARVFAAGSRAEAPIVGRVVGISVRGIVDRLLVGEDEVEVLDFKSDRPSPSLAEDAPDGYVLQMGLYRAVLSQIFPRKTIRCALLWTEKPILVELSAAQMEAALQAVKVS